MSFLQGPDRAPLIMSPAVFEVLARRVMSDLFGASLATGTHPAVSKKFDFVSLDCSIVGDAKYFTRVGGVKKPSAKLSVIAESVVLLEKTDAPCQFLVFGTTGPFH